MLKFLINPLINIMSAFIRDRDARHEFRNQKKRNLYKLLNSPSLYFYDYFRNKLQISNIYLSNKHISENKQHGLFSSRYFDFLESHPEFFGFNRYCNICGYRFSKFDTTGVLAIREGRCPVCMSVERHRHLYIHIQSLYPFLDGKKILHFAPEPVFKEIFLKSKAEYFDADIEPNKATYKIDMTDIKFDDNTFDYIFATHVLEHIPDDVKAMTELHRVLKKGGTAYLAVPLRKEFAEDLTITDPKQRELLYGQSDHVRYYNMETFCRRLQIAGFNTDMVSRIDALPSICKESKLSDSYVLARKL